MFIVFEGIDHSFKETNSKKLCQYLNDCGFENVLHTEFPNYESEYGKAIKKMLSSDSEIDRNELMLLFTKDKLSAYINTIKPFLTKDKAIVVSDRWKYSNLAYNYDMKDTVAYMAEKSLYNADIIIYMDMNPDYIKEKVYERARAKGEEPDKNETNIEYLKRVHKEYDRIFDKSKWVRIKCLDEDGNVRLEDDIFNDIVNNIFEKIYTKKGVDLGGYNGWFV